MKKLRILMPFTWAVGGGSFISAALLAKGLLELGHDVLALFPEDGPSSDVFKHYNVPVKIMATPVVRPVNGKVYDLFGFIKDSFQTSLYARKFIKSERFDVVHCNDGLSLLSWGLVARLQGVSCIWHVRNAHAGLMHQLRLRIPHQAICISHYVANLLPENINKTVIYNPVDTVRFRPTDDKVRARSELGLTPCELQLIQIGRDVPYKRPEWSIKALNDLLQSGWDARLLYLGSFSSERQSELLSLLSEDARQRVTFTGWIENAEDYLAASDLLLHPADGEHFGRIFVEATACGVPFVAMNQGAAPELVEAGLYGKIMPTDSAEEISKHVEELMAEQVWSNERNNALDGFTYIKHAKAVCKVYLY